MKTNGIARIQQQFKRGKVFAAYLTAGDGGIQKTLTAALSLIEAGVNLLEIGVPFSDPIADGPIIQRAAQRALQAYTTLKDIFWLTHEIRKQSTIPIVLFSYLNPLLSSFQGSFFQDAVSAGIDGVLLVDCPIEESTQFHTHCLQHGIAPIYVIAPSTSLARVAEIAVNGAGFLYYACRKGTTGIRASLPDDFAAKMQSIRAQTKLPIVAGFGIGDQTIAKTVLNHADGVVIGSRFVKAIEDCFSAVQLRDLAKSINPL